MGCQMMVLHLACPAQWFQTPQERPFWGSSWRSGSLSLSTSSSLRPQAPSSPPLCLPGSSLPHCMSFLLHHLPQTSQQPAKFIHPVFWGDGSGSVRLFSCPNARSPPQEDVYSQVSSCAPDVGPPLPRMLAPDKRQIAGVASPRCPLPSAGLPPSATKKITCFPSVARPRAHLSNRVQSVSMDLVSIKAQRAG